MWRDDVTTLEHNNILYDYNHYNMAIFFFFNRSSYVNYYYPWGFYFPFENNIFITTRHVRVSFVRVQSLRHYAIMHDDSSRSSALGSPRVINQPLVQVKRFSSFNGNTSLHQHCDDNITPASLSTISQDFNDFWTWVADSTRTWGGKRIAWFTRSDRSSWVSLEKTIYKS